VSKSLQDQLMALGLAREEQGADSTAGRGQSGKKSTGKIPAPGRPGKRRSKGAASRKKPSGTGSGREVSLADAYKLREKDAREKLERAREEKRLEDLKRRAMNKAIRAIVEPNRLNDEKAELSRNFMYKSRIRKVNVTASQQKALNEGELGLVYLSGSYHILSAAHVAEVRKLSPDHVPDLSGAEPADPEAENEFPVPDDLVW